MASFDDQIREWTRRLNQLKLQVARGGPMSDPHIFIEIEDLERQLSKADEIKHQFTLLETYRQNAAHLLRQRALLGVRADVGIVNGLSDARKNIASIKRALWKHYSVRVEAAPEDEDAVVEDVRPAPLPSSPDATVEMWEGLRDLEALIRADRKDAALLLVRRLQRLMR